MIAAPRTEPDDEDFVDTEHEADDFVDSSVVPPTLSVEVWRPSAGDGSRAHTLAVPPSLVAEALA